MGDLDSNDDLFDGWTRPVVVAPVFANRAVELRTTRRWSLRQAAARLGVSHVYVGNVERGERPSAQYVVLMAELYAVDVDELAAAAGVLPPDLEPVLRDPDVLAMLRRIKTERGL